MPFAPPGNCKQTDSIMQSQQGIMRKNDSIAIVFFVLGGMLVLLIDFLANRDELDELQLATRITAEQLELRLESCLAPRLALINLLAQDWNSWAVLESDWQRVASTTYGILPGVQALNLVSSDRVIEQVYPLAGNESALGAQLSEHPSPDVSLTITRAEETGALQRTAALELLQSGAGIAMYKTIQDSNGQVLGYVNGVFRIAELFSTCFAEQNLYDLYNFRILESDGAEIYLAEGEEEENLWQYSIGSAIDVAGRPWLLELAPTTNRIRALNSSVQNLWLGLGLLLVLLLSLATRSALNSRDSLELSRERYKLLVENQSDLLIKLTPDGKILYASPNFCRLAGKTEAELLDSNFIDEVDPTNRELVIEQFSSLVAEKRSNKHIMRIAVNNESRWIEWSSSLVLDETDAVKFIISVGRDITEQKSMEMQIAHSEKMRAIGELAGGISHDFNNLLQIILANIELLLMNKGTDDGEKRLENIRNAVNSGIELTSGLSTLSKQDNAEEEILILNSLLTENMKLMGRSLPVHITLGCDLPDQPVVIRGNRSQIERVLFNLCFNARDAIGDTGNIDFELREVELDAELYAAHEHLRAGPFARISVKDNGSGIDPQVLPRIFEPFFSTKKKDKGTGLGLANCYSIIVQSGGIITVESSPGTGSQFNIFLPLLVEDENGVS